jgi:predicted dehydrogenase
MRNQLQYAIIGAGAIARAYADALQRTAQIAVVAVVDVLPEAAQILAGELGCSYSSSVTALLSERDVDIAVVCTPPATHAAISIELLNRGVHVLCEKPFSLSVEDALSMIFAANANGVKLTMASKFRYVDDVVTARAMLWSGSIGEPILLENTFTQRVDMSNRWNSNPQLSGGGVLIDNGTHSVDVIRYFLGEVAEVTALEGKRCENLAVEETVSLFTRNDSKVRAKAELSWAITKRTKTYLDVYGSEGVISVGWQESLHVDNASGKVTVIGGGYDKGAAFRKQIQNISAAVRGEEELFVKPDDALASVAVIQAAYGAMYSGHRWASVLPVSEILYRDPLVGSRK